jgi:NADPH-dependent glutamate synthase beta subunit-like oxidoreductase/ferredoxin
VSTVTLQINSQTVTVPAGSTVLDAARELGIDIPTFCFKDGLAPVTSCFVCIVKDEKTGRFLPSCTAPAINDMQIDASGADVRDMRKTALELLMSEHSGDCEAPCTIACPGHARVEEYVQAGKRGDMLEALKIIKERIPLPMSIGRVCPRFCEKECRRQVLDNAIAINDFKRLAADMYYDDYMEDCLPLNGKTVALIGAGPAGLATAYFLRLQGVASDLYEMMPEAGGMLRYGIPEYRLPKSILNRELAHFEKMGGIQIFCNKKLGNNLSLDDLKNKYDAVVVCVGSWKSSSARIEGEELAIGGIQFLEKLALNNWKGDNPGKTIVIGGGNTAMDCLRTSVRLGSDEVFCYYRRTEKEMPAEEIEYQEALEEGVKFEFLTAPQKLREENGRKVLTCLRMKLGEPDASGRRRPVPIEGSEFDVTADTVIAAIGQKTVAPPGIEPNRWGDIDASTKDGSVNDAMVFAAGDCVTGPATVVEAVALGHRAAMGILARFEGTTYEDPQEWNISRGHPNFLSPDDIVSIETPGESDRIPQRLIPVGERKTTFKEVSYTFTKDEILTEGDRCIQCSCTEKKDCALRVVCGSYEADPDKFGGTKRKYPVDTRHPYVILDPNKCIKCGACIQASREHLNKSILSFMERGFSTRIGTAFGREIEMSLEESKIIVEVCPTGALSFKKSAQELIEKI